MIYVLATIEVGDGQRDAFLKHFRELVPKVHAEEGCIEYGPTVDVETNIGAQIPPRPNIITVVEKWADVEALEHHLIAPHMLEYREMVKDLVKSVSLQIVEPA